MSSKRDKKIEQYTERLEQFNRELYEKYSALRRLLIAAPTDFDTSTIPYLFLNNIYDSYRGWIEVYNVPKLSKIVIDNDFNIRLPFYHMQLELPPIPKTIYLFYLMHPQGVSNSDIPQYEKCITEIYHNVSKYNDRADQDDTVHELINNREKWTKNLNKLNSLISNPLQDKHEIVSIDYKIHFEKDLALHKMNLPSTKIFLNQYMKGLL